MGTFSNLVKELIEIKSDLHSIENRLNEVILKTDKIRESFKWTPKERIEYLQNELNKLKGESNGR